MVAVAARHRDRAEAFAQRYGIPTVNDNAEAVMLEFSLSNAHIICDLTHGGPMRAYAPDPAVFADEYIVEKLETKAGWSFPSTDEEWALGYPQEIRAFAEAVIEDHPPRSDAPLGRDVVNALQRLSQRRRRAAWHSSAMRGASTSAPP